MFACLEMVLLCSCFSVTVAVTKHHDQSNLGGKGFFSLHFHTTVHHQRTGREFTQGWNLEAGAVEEAMEGYCLLACLPWLASSACILREPRATRPGMAVITMGWVLPRPRQSLNKKLPYSLILWGHSLSWGSFFQMNLACIKLT